MAVENRQYKQFSYSYTADTDVDPKRKWRYRSRRYTCNLERQWATPNTEYQDGGQEPEVVISQQVSVINNVIRNLKIDSISKQVHLTWCKNGLHIFIG